MYRLTVLILTVLWSSAALGQAWQVPANTIPYGKGPGQNNFGSVANTGSGTLCLLNTAPPSFGTCSGSLPTLNSGRLFVGNGSNVAVAVALSGDCTLVAAGAITCTKTGGVVFGAFATGTDATNLTGTVASARISGSYTGITAVGTIATGVWQGTAIDTTRGGFGTSVAAVTGVPIFTAGTPAFQATMGTGNVARTDGSMFTNGAFNGTVGATTPSTIAGTTGSFNSTFTQSGGFAYFGNFNAGGLFPSSAPSGVGIATAINATNGSLDAALFNTATNATTSFVFNQMTGATAYSTLMTMLANGNIGIGTTAPTYSLDIVHNSNDFARMRILNSNAGASAGSILTFSNGTANAFAGVRGSAQSATGMILPNDAQFSGDQAVSIAAAGGPIKFAAGGTTEQMRIATNGNVSIGTTTPDFVGSAGLYAAISGEAGGANNPARIGVGGNITGTANFAGSFNVYNSAIGAADKRIANISVATDGATNSGKLSFNTFNTGTPTTWLTIDHLGVTTLGSGGGALKSGSTGIGGISGCLASDGSSPANITAGPCGTGLPGGGTVGQAVLNTASGTGNWFTQQFYNISANASTDCTGVVATSISTVIGSNTNALIPPGCTVKVSADDTIGVTKTLLVQCGATVSIDTTKTLTINARFIDPGPCSLFTVAGTGKVQGIRDVRPEWFNCDTGTPNYEPCITRAIYSVENAASSAGDTFRISFQCSTYSYRATLTFTPTSAIPWRGKGCGDGTTLLESHSTFTGTSGVVVTNGADTTVHWTFEGIEFVNKTAGSGATVGITIGGTTAAQIMGGYSRSSFKNGHVSGYATNVLQQNARMINYDNFSSWPNDNSGGVVSSPVGWKLTANLNGFVGDTDWINGSQCTSKNNNVTFTGSTAGGTTLTVSAISAGAITIGMKIVTAVPGAPTVLAQLTGSAGSTGTYTLGQSTTVGSTSMLGVYGTGNCVVMQDDGSNAIHISGIGFEAPFTCYYGATCWKVSITAPGTIFDDFWVSPRVQAESYGNGHALEVTASGSGTLWRNFNMNGIYFAGYGWEKNIYMLNNTSATAKDLQANNNYFAGTTFEAVDVRGTGGSNCLGITANGNILREPSLDGLANSAIYLENCGSSTVSNNTMEGTVGVVRANVVKFNSGGNYLTCVGNNSGGITTASGTSNVCVNSAGAAQFVNGSNQ